MSSLANVPAGEIGVLRLFALDMPREQIRFLNEPGAVDNILAVEGLDPEHVEIFAISDLDDLGLPGYLIEGHAIPEEQIDPALSNQDGFVLLVHSRAFGGNAMTLAPTAGVSPLGVFTPTATDWTARPEPTPDSAKPRGGSGQSPRAARARARRLGGSIFALVMLIVAFVIYLVIR